MYRETVPSKQLGAWLAAGLCPVVVQLAPPMSWPIVAVASLICLLAVGVVLHWGSFGRWTSLPAGILLVIVTGQILREAATVWTGNSYPAVPLMLLALALWSALKGASAAARVGCVLFWAVLIIYPVVFGAALQDVHWQWIRQGEPMKWEIILLLLVATLGKILLKRGEPASRRLLLPGLFATVACFLTVGVLSVTAESGFYEMVRSIDLLGVVKHFEALISAGATLGWFALLNYVLTVCAAVGETVMNRGQLFAVAGAVGAAVWMLCNLHIPTGILLVFVAVFWVLLPVLTQGIEGAKNIKKRKK